MFLAILLLRDLAATRPRPRRPPRGRRSAAAPEDTLERARPADSRVNVILAKYLFHPSRPRHTGVANCRRCLPSHPARCGVVGLYPAYLADPSTKRVSLSVGDSVAAQIGEFAVTDSISRSDGVMDACSATRPSPTARAGPGGPAREPAQHRPRRVWRRLPRCRRRPWLAPILHGASPTASGQRFGQSRAFRFPHGDASVHRC